MQQAKKEYWDLVRKLNSGNKVRNLKTEVKFFVIKNSASLLDSVARTSEVNLVLCSEFDHNRWAISEHT